MKIKITADSTCDLSPELIEKYDIRIPPLYIVRDGQSLVDGKDITTSAELIDAKNTHKAGDEMTLTVYRDKDFTTLKVTLDEQQPNSDEEQDSQQDQQGQSGQSQQGQSGQSGQGQQGQGGQYYYSWPFGNSGW